MVNRNNVKFNLLAPKCTICTIISKHMTAGCHRRWGLLLGRLKLCIFFFRLLVHHKHTTVPVKFRNLSTSLLRDSDKPHTLSSVGWFFVRLPSTFCAQSTSAPGLNFSPAASFKNFFAFLTLFYFDTFFYCFLNSRWTPTARAQDSNGLVQEICINFFCCCWLELFVRFSFFARWFWTAWQQALPECADTFDWRSKACPRDDKWPSLEVGKEKKTERRKLFFMVTLRWS